MKNTALPPVLSEAEAKAKNADCVRPINKNIVDNSNVYR
jgi:hypothetical protein